MLQRPVVLQGEPHWLAGGDCLDRVLTQFVERGSVKDLDTSCAKNIKRNGFALKL